VGGLAGCEAERGPHTLQIVHGQPGRDEQIANIQALIRNMGKLGVRCLCYNWMPADDWSRTSAEVRERGGSRVTAFDLKEVRPPPARLHALASISAARRRPRRTS
jgi:mannonate dehydratase